MAVVADTTAQSIEVLIDPKKDIVITQSSPTRKTHIHEHPFMKEVRFDRSFLSIIFIQLLTVYHKWSKCFDSKCRYSTQ